MSADFEVVFTRRAFNSIVTETISKHPIETGGILLGVYHESGVWVVLENIPPGYLSRHSWAEFSYDEEFVRYLANTVARQYKCKLEVLGLWHRHPGSMDYFSSVDDGTNIKYAGMNSMGAISALVNCDPKMRLTMYHVGAGLKYTKIPWSVDDGTMIPDSFTALRFPDTDSLPVFDGDSLLSSSATAPKHKDDKSDTRQTDESNDAEDDKPQNTRQSATSPDSDKDEPSDASKEKEEKESSAPDRVLPTKIKARSSYELCSVTDHAMALVGSYCSASGTYYLYPEDNAPQDTAVVGYLLPDSILDILGSDVKDSIVPLNGKKTHSWLIAAIKSLFGCGKKAVPIFTPDELKRQLGVFYPMIPESWWIEQFLPALNGEPGAYTLLGESMPDQSVRLVQIGSMVEVQILSSKEEVDKSIYSY